MSESIALSRRTILFMPLVAVACRRGPDVLELSGTTMGTSYSITAVDQDRRLDDRMLRASVETALLKVNRHLSNWDGASEVSRFNAAATQQPISASPVFTQVMQAAEDVHLASDGAFDITLGPVIETWGFGAPVNGYARPSSDAILAALQDVGQDQLRITPTAITKSNPQTQVYLSGIGKGFGVDEVARALAQAGVTDFMVEIGGDLFASGRNPDGLPWQIGIETPDPFDRTVQSVAEISGFGVATSGDYRNFFETDGIRYSHILDPRTGRPVTHSTASATVLAETAMMADAWSTAMLALGSAHGRELANQHNIAVLFIDREGHALRQHASARFRALQA